MAYTTVDQIVRDLQGDKGMNTTHDYLRLLNITNRGLKELTFDILGSTKVVLLEVDNSMRIDLPGDFVDHTYIGVINNGYQLEPLGLNRRTPLTGNVNNKTASHDEYHYLYGGLYGLGGGQNRNGYYAGEIDAENWQIILSSVAVGLTVYLEYISDGRQEGGQNVVHPYAEEALVSWTYWKSIQRRRDYAQSEKQAARQDYYNEKRKARARLKSFTKEEALQQFRKGFKQAPKV